MTLRSAQGVQRLRWTALAYLAWIVGYEAVGWCAHALPAHDLSVGLDRAIPLVPSWIWVYELTYVLPFLAVLFIDTSERFVRALLAIGLASVSAYVVYLCFPVAFEHPALSGSLAERWIAMEYRFDFPPRGANHLPSLHVANALILCRAVDNARWSAAGRVLTYALGAAIALSTLLVKQHLVLDVVAGLVWGAAAWAAAPSLRAIRTAS